MQVEPRGAGLVGFKFPLKWHAPLNDPITKKELEG